MKYGVPGCDVPCGVAGCDVVLVGVAACDVWCSVAGCTCMGWCGCV